MDQLLSYLNGLPQEEREAFARRCGCSVKYLRKAASIKQRLGEGLCLRIGIESSWAVKPEQLRPDVDWKRMREALMGQAKGETSHA